MRAVNYITEVNKFRKFAYDNYMSKDAVLLWYALFGVNNDLYFKDWFKVDNIRLMGYAFLKREATLISARNELIEMGLIQFKKGSKGNPSEYHIVMFSEQEQNTEKEDNKDTENTDNNVPNADNANNNQSQPQNTEHTADNDTNNTTAANERKQYKNAGYMFYYYKSNKPKKKETDNTYKPKDYKTEYKVQKQPQNRFNNFPQRDIDIDALEKYYCQMQKK